MANLSLLNSAPEAARAELKSYNVTIPMSSLSIGVDNIHHDVFMSPKFAQAARDYIFDLIRQNTKASYFPGIELRATRGPDNAAFRKLLIDLLQSALTQAKYHKNIEMDLLFRLTLLKFLIAEIGNQFASLILEGKEWVRQRGEHFERSQQAHVIKARLSELQSVRRAVIRVVGQQVAQIVVDVEENVIAKARRALFGEDFAPLYELLKNRLIFLDGGKDDVYFLEHYVLLGNYARDPDRFESVDLLFQALAEKCGAGDRSGSRARGSEKRLRRFAGAGAGDARRYRQSRSAGRRGTQKNRAWRRVHHEISQLRGSVRPARLVDGFRITFEASGRQAGTIWSANRRRQAESGFLGKAVSEPSGRLPEQSGKCAALV